MILSLLLLQLMCLGLLVALVWQGRAARREAERAVAVRKLTTAIRTADFEASGAGSKALQARLARRRPQEAPVGD